MKNKQKEIRIKEHEELLFIGTNGKRNKFLNTISPSAMKNANKTYSKTIRTVFQNISQKDVMQKETYNQQLEDMHVIIIKPG
jgi:hypothetical protein